MLFQLRVRPVARRLDKDMPGWHRRVDLRHLDMRSNYGCVLGQVYGGYRNAPAYVKRDRTVLGKVLFDDAHAVPLVFGRENGWHRAIKRRLRRDERRARREHARHIRELEQAPPLTDAQVKLLALVYRSERNQVQAPQPEPRYEEVLPG